MLNWPLCHVLPFYWLPKEEVTSIAPHSLAEAVSVKGSVREYNGFSFFGLENIILFLDIRPLAPFLNEPLTISLTTIVAVVAIAPNDNLNFCLQSSKLLDSNVNEK